MQARSAVSAAPLAVQVNAPMLSIGAFGETGILLCVIGPATTPADAIVVPGTSRPTPPPPRELFFFYFVRVLPTETLIIPRDDRVLSKTRHHGMGDLVLAMVSGVTRSDGIFYS